KPSITIDYSWNDSTKSETITIEQVQDFQKNPLYKIPLLVDIYHDGKVERKKITIEKVKEDFVFRLPSKPDLVNVDAEKMLLCVKKDNKAKEDLIFQFYHAPLYLDRYEAVSNIKASNVTEAKMMEDALNDKFWNIRLVAIKNISETAKGNTGLVKPKLLGLAKNDDKSQVRAAALRALAKIYPGDSLIPVYENALNDSSFLVMTTAFKIICDQDEKKGFVLAKNLEHASEPDISSAVA